MALLNWRIGRLENHVFFRSTFGSLALSAPLVTGFKCHLPAGWPSWKKHTHTRDPYGMRVFTYLIEPYFLSSHFSHSLHYENGDWIIVVLGRSVS